MIVFSLHFYTSLLPNTDKLIKNLRLTHAQHRKTTVFHFNVDKKQVEDRKLLVHQLFCVATNHFVLLERL